MKRSRCFVFFLIAQSILFPCFSDSLPERKVDAVILGGGIGGLTAALYLGRGGVRPLVVEGKSPGGAIVGSENVGNWPGEIEITGFDLVRKIREQAEKSGAILCSEEVVEVDFHSSPFTVLVRDIYDPSKQRKLLTEVCIIAMGSVPKKLDVPGESEYASRGVYTCAVCDGPLYKDKTVAVVGGGDVALLEARYLSGIAKQVYVIVRGSEWKGIEKERRDSLLSKDNVTIFYNTSVERITGSDAGVEKIVIRKDRGPLKELLVDAVFTAIGSTPNTSLFSGKLEVDSGGYIVLKNHTETSVPGVFAVGDIADPFFKQAVSAGGEGAKAALQAQKYLVKVGSETKSSLPALQKISAGSVEIRSLDQLHEILHSSRVPVFVDFYAPWCSPCRYLSPFIETWAKDLEGKFLFCKVNIDGMHEVAREYGIMSMPTVIHFNASGREVARRTGPGEIIRYVDCVKNN